MILEDKLSPAEFERLFALSVSEYGTQVPGWVRQVESIDVREGVDSLLDQLKDATKKTTKLEGVLKRNGVPIPQDIPYLVAKQKVMEIQQRIMSGDLPDKDYMELCNQMETYMTAMTSSDEYHEEMRQQEAKWEEQHRAENMEALKMLRRHMPVRIRFLSEDALVTDHKLPRPIARKFKRTDVLSLIRKAPDAVAKMHPGILENLKTGGLTLTERRALYEHLRTIAPKWIKAKDEMSQRKAQWYNNFKSKFKESADAWYKHKEEYGSPAGHGKCNKIGMQCPFKADNVDYSGDYGFPIGDEYEEDNVTKAPKPFVKDEPSSPKRAANPMMAALAGGLPKPQGKPSFLGELSSKKAATPAVSSTPTKSSPMTPTRAPAVESKKIVMEDIVKKTPEELAAEKAAQQKASAETKYAAKKAARDSVLETHYKSNDDDLADGRAICYAMEDKMDDMEAMLEEWIDYVIRSGKKKLDEDAIEEEIWDFKDAVEPLQNVIEQYLDRLGEVGPSTVECELAEDLYLFSQVFLNFMEWRMNVLKQKDAELTESIAEAQKKLKKLYQKNAKTLKKFGVKAERTRAIPSAKGMMDERKKKIEKMNNKMAVSAPKPAAAAAPQAIPRTSTHKASPPKAEPAAVPKRASVVSNSRTMEYQGKDPLKWQLVHQVNGEQKMIRRLEAAIAAAGLAIPDDTIPYQEAEAKMAEISKQMAAISFQHPDYFKLEQEMSKYSAALMASDEYRRETERREREWEAAVRPLNREALKKLRRHMPVNVRKMSEAELSAKIPAALAKKFKRTNILQLIRVNPNDVAKFHYSNFEGLSLSGMTLTERRAVYEHLSTIGPIWYKQKGNEQTERKWMWFQSMKNKFRDELKKCETHIDEFGAPGSHQCKFIGNQCPVKANDVVNYDGDFGFPDGPEYEKMEVAREDLSHSHKRAKELRDQRSESSPKRSPMAGIAAGIRR